MLLVLTLNTFKTRNVSCRLTFCFYFSNTFTASVFCHFKISNSIKKNYLNICNNLASYAFSIDHKSRNASSRFPFCFYATTLTTLLPFQNIFFYQKNIRTHVIILLPMLFLLALDRDYIWQIHTHFPQSLAAFIQKIHSLFL